MAYKLQQKPTQEEIVKIAKSFGGNGSSDYLASTLYCDVSLGRSRIKNYLTRCEKKAMSGSVRKTIQNVGEMYNNFFETGRYLKILDIVNNRALSPNELGRQKIAQGLSFLSESRLQRMVYDTQENENLRNVCSKILDEHLYKNLSRDESTKTWTKYPVVSEEILEKEKKKLEEKARGFEKIIGDRKGADRICKNLALIHGEVPSELLRLIAGLNPGEMSESN